MSADTAAAARFKVAQLVTTRTACGRRISVISTSETLRYGERFVETALQVLPLLWVEHIDQPAPDTLVRFCDTFGLAPEDIVTHAVSPVPDKLKVKHAGVDTNHLAGFHEADIYLPDGRKMRFRCHNKLDGLVFHALRVLVESRVVSVSEPTCQPYSTFADELASWAQERGLTLDTEKAKVHFRYSME